MEPWKRIELDPEHAGSWFVSGDLDGDGRAEIVTARSVQYWVGKSDHHYTCAVAAQNLEGEVLWTWGAPGSGSGELWHDVSCQVFDWDGDGRPEVILASQGALVVLEGATGTELRRLPLPEYATDCITFCNLSGGPRPDVLVKTRYSQLWAYSHDWDLLWTLEKPGGYPTAHQAYPVDLDGCGQHCVMAGHVMLNPDGTRRWLVTAPKDEPGHVDAVRVLKAGDRPRDFRLAVTFCGSGRIEVIDGLGRRMWGLSGHHFESIDIGRIFPDLPEKQILVDLYVPSPDPYPVWVLSAEGDVLAEIITKDGRHHDLLDWNGDGLDEIVVAYEPLIYNGQGQVIERLEVAEGDEVRDCVPLHLTADGPMYLALTTMTGNALYLYESPGGKLADGQPPRVGTEMNATLY